MMGPLDGVRVLEFAGLGPVPFCGMLLSDLGADVIQVNRPGTPPPAAHAVTSRGRCHLVLDLKQPGDAERCRALCAQADVVIEGFRPGVLERLGLGPDLMLARNPRLVVGRMTGWGQSGPYAQMAGHDLNYIALSGALHAIGPAARPIPPLNLVGDFGGGALYLAMGILAGLLHARETGQGQVIDCAISDGAASLMSMLYGYMADGRWTDRRESNRLDGGAHFYAPYQCLDGQWITIGAIEPQFYAELLELLGLDADASFQRQGDEKAWPELRSKVAACIATRTRDEWCRVLEGTDACFAPMMSMTEAHLHVHNEARQTFVRHDGVMQPAPAPRFSATPAEIQHGARTPEEVALVLARWMSSGRVGPEATS